jgi:hypothetical protein
VPVVVAAPKGGPPVGGPRAGRAGEPASGLVKKCRYHSAAV